MPRLPGQGTKEHTMESYYASRNLPHPAIPELKPLGLLKGQTALMTGANSGIGRAIAVALGRAGANVVVNYVANPADAEAVAEEIRGGGQRAITALADVADEAQVQAMFAAAVQEFGTVDILVSNAGMERNAPFHEMTVAQWDAVMSVNPRARRCASSSAAACARAFQWQPARSSLPVRCTKSSRGPAMSTTQPPRAA